MDVNTRLMVLAVVLAVVSKRRPRVNRFAFRNTLWKDVNNSATTAANGWFKQELKMSKQSFDIIEGRIASNWTKLYNIPNYNAAFDIRQRVAIAIHYMTHKSVLSVTGSVFGLSKAQVHKYLHQVLIFHYRL
jgi:hypothetical protein